jgi:hypothetical protein
MPAFETLAIASPIMRFVGTSVMPGLCFQPISLVRIDPVPVARTTAILRSGLTALAALVFKPRPETNCRARRKPPNTGNRRQSDPNGNSSGKERHHLRVGDPGVSLRPG